LFKESSVFSLGNEVPTTVEEIFCILYFGAFSHIVEYFTLSWGFTALV